MKTPDEIIEVGVNEIYRGLYRLHKEQKYQDEYDIMGTIISILSEDRQLFREKYKETLNV